MEAWRPPRKKAKGTGREKLEFTSFKYHHFPSGLPPWHHIGSRIPIFATSSRSTVPSSHCLVFNDIFNNIHQGETVTCSMGSDLAAGSCLLANLAEPDPFSKSSFYPKSKSKWDVQPQFSGSQRWQATVKPSIFSVLRHSSQRSVSTHSPPSHCISALLRLTSSTNIRLYI